MAKIIKKLTDTEVRNAKPKEKDYTLRDGEGLRCRVRKSGTKVWQYYYVISDVPNTFTIGKYPEVSLVEAREARDEARKFVRQGIDPTQQKKLALRAAANSSSNSFETVAREWHSKQVWNKKHAQNILMTLEKDAFPAIGHRPINSISPREIIDMLRTVEARGALDVAKRLNQRCTAVFDYAIVADLCDVNPALGRTKIIQKRDVVHRPCLKEAQIPEFLSKIESYQGGKIIQIALKLLLLTFVRPGELRGARWDEFNFDTAEWIIPASRMKMKRGHVVPLSVQSIALLKELRKMTGKTELLFPGSRDSSKPISDVTLLKAIKIMGYVGEKKIVPHGMRATASTVLNDSKLFRPDVIEAQLAHVDRNKVRAAYNRALYLHERTAMMQWWADHLNVKTPSSIE